ncbi:MAG: hypothetical protein JXM73_22545 [Anaerolineae bacterium]|nr:hypothetical protein [Anaerolineae bacterium]
MMKVKRVVFTVLAVSMLLLATGIGIGAGSPASALPGPSAEQTGVTIPYAGRLSDAVGQPVANGSYDLVFTLYGTTVDGEPLWSEMQQGVAVSAGEFLTYLGSVEAIPTALGGQDLWLAVSVRGPGDAGFTALTPRQRVRAATPDQGAPCAHDHFGEHWTGDSGAQGNGLRVENTWTDGYGITGVAHTGVNALGVLGWTTSGTGVKGQSTSNVGVEGMSTSGDGVWGHSETGTGVYGSGDYGLHGMGTTYGVNGYSSDGTGVYGISGHYAVHALGTGGTSAHPALRADNWNSTNGMAAYFTNNSGHPTLEMDQAGSGRVLDLQNGGDSSGAGGDDFIAGYSRDSDLDMQFRITSSGQGRSDVGWTTPAEDFAEMLPAVQGLEPGDVLVIGPDGRLARSTEAYQTSVAGVYSTQPGFLGGQPVEGEVEGAIPLAVVGVVPVKVSAENGPIRPGDLLVSSSTAGYAMRAGPNPPQGSVLGKAMGKWDAGLGVITMLATLQ